MASYIAAFDDSGENGPIIKPNGTPGSRGGFLTLVAGAFIEKEVLEEFDSQWGALRDDIARALGLSVPPAIHLRLMWGRTLPMEYRRGHPNPYRRANFNQIRQWVGDAWDIVGQYVSSKRGGWFTNLVLREAHIDGQLRFTQHPTFAAELTMLRKALGPCWKGYSNILHSSILPLYAQSLVHLNELMLATRSDADVLFDNWSEARAVDIGTTINSTIGLLQLDLIKGTVAVGDPDSSALLQMADLVAYYKARETRWVHNNIKPDKELHALAKVRSGFLITSANIPHRVTRRYGSALNMSIPIHFAVARRFVEDCRPDVAEQHLKTVDEFIASMPRDVKETLDGVSVLKS